MRTAPRKPIALVTGASGLIGARCADRLAGDYRVIGLDRPGFPHPPLSTDNVRIAGVYDDLCHSIPLAHQIEADL